MAKLKPEGMLQVPPEPRLTPATERSDRPIFLHHGLPGEFISAALPSPAWVQVMQCGPP